MIAIQEISFPQSNKEFLSIGILTIISHWYNASLVVSQVHVLIRDSDPRISHILSAFIWMILSFLVMMVIMITCFMRCMYSTLDNQIRITSVECCACQSMVLHKLYEVIDCLGVMVLVEFEFKVTNWLAIFGERKENSWIWFWGVVVQGNASLIAVDHLSYHLVQIKNS